MNAYWAAALFFAVGASAGEPRGVVRRGDLPIIVKFSGTVVPDEIDRVKSAIEGRVERILGSTGTWRFPNEPMAMLANKELAALIDAKGSQNQDVLEDRWQRMYRLTPVGCRQACFILRNYMKTGSWVKPQAVLMETAGALKLVARIRPEDAPWVRDGQEIEFWPTADPKKKLKGKVYRFVLDVQGQKIEPGGTFTLVFAPERWLPPGTEVSGEIRPLVKKGVLLAPTSALIKMGDAYYLPKRVSIGTTREELTEITGGANAGEEFLSLEDAKLSTATCVARHQLQAEHAELKAVCDRALAAISSAPLPPSPYGRNAAAQSQAPAPAPEAPISEPGANRPAEPKRAERPAPKPRPAREPEYIPRPQPEVIKSEEPEDPYGEP